MVEALIGSVACWGIGGLVWAAPGLKYDVRYWVEQWKGEVAK